LAITPLHHDDDSGLQNNSFGHRTTAFDILEQWIVVISRVYVYEQSIDISKSLCYEIFIVCLCATHHHNSEDEERLLVTAYVQAEVQAWLLENTSKDGALLERTAEEISVALKTKDSLSARFAPGNLEQSRSSHYVFDQRVV
jgi:plasmid stability protein